MVSDCIVHTVFNFYFDINEFYLIKKKTSLDLRLVQTIRFLPQL